MKRIVSSDEERLIRAGWKKKGKLWKSPYSGLRLTEEQAVRVELIRKGD